MAKKKIANYFSQTDWMNMDDPTKRKIAAGYLKDAKDYLSAWDKNPISHDPRSAWIPYADPAMAGTQTANMMMFQNVMRPRGEDRSEGAMQELGEKTSNRIESNLSNINPDQFSNEIGNDVSLADTLRYRGAKRGTDYLSPDVNDYLNKIDALKKHNRYRR